ncbi:Uncharacterised protein [Shigella sonnei]|nr:Uncharacterised protein [Shigella sonnei]CSF13017.1 Uncharacterised protein [Shigella sonnei]CSG30885.1 Uncharacterised protein [Shigella sonnei]CSH70135.1 Uncharacterised protein [Shigella sonnei]CSP57023.1 Uncharacterised protein [Shigella sonnei]
MMYTCQQRFNRHRTRAVGAVNGDNVRARLRQRIDIFNIGRDAYRRILQIAFHNSNNRHAHHRTRGLQICHTFDANGNRARLLCR